MNQITEFLINQLGNLQEQFLSWIAIVDWERVVAALLFLAIVILLRNRIGQIAIWLAKKTAGWLNFTIDENTEKTITPVAIILPVIFAMILVLDMLQMPQTISDTLAKVLYSIAIISVFSVIHELTRPFASILAPYRRRETQTQIDWSLRLIQFILIVLGLAAVLKIWGIDLGSIITGMGIFGAAVALATQDLVRNLVAGLTNISEQRFEVGDWIKIEGGAEGIVEKVDFRSTQIRGFDQSLAHVPNGDLANCAVTNFSRMPHRRINLTFELVHSTPNAKLQQIRDEIRDYIDNSELFMDEKDAPRYVNITTPEGAAIGMLVYCFTVANSYPDFLSARETLVFKIRSIIEETGSAFAFPGRSVFLHEDGETAE